MKPLLHTLFFLVLLLLSSTGSLYAIDMNNPFKQLQMDSWTVADGLPDDYITEILQTQDGFIWMLGPNALIKYDGYEFISYDTLFSFSPNQDHTLVLFEDRLGDLWIGYHNKGVRYRNGNFQFFELPGATEDTYVSAICQDIDFSIWLGTEQDGLYHLVGDTITHYTTEDGLISNTISALGMDDQGTLWIGTRYSGLMRYDGEQFCTPGVFTQVEESMGRADSIVAMDTDQSGTLWIMSHECLAKVIQGSVVLEPFRITEFDQILITFFMDSHDQVWLGTLGGLRRYQKGALYLDPSIQELHHLMPSGFCADRKNNLWFSTFGFGVFRISAKPFSAIKEEHGLRENRIIAIMEGPENDLWVGSEKGLSRCKKKDNAITITHIDESHGFIPEMVFNFLVDSKNQFWICRSSGVSCNKDNQFIHYPYAEPNFKSPIYAIYESNNEYYYLYTHRGLYYLDLREESPQLKPYPKNKKLASTFLNGIVKDADGFFWIGVEEDGLYTNAYSKDHTFEKLPDLPDTVYPWFMDDQSRLWFGLQQGMALYEKGSVFQISKESGLDFLSASHAILDNDGYLWIRHDGGLTRLSKDDIEAYKNHIIDYIPHYNFSHADGIHPIIEPNMFLSKEEILYIPSWDGIAFMDVHSFAPEVPEVYFQSIAFDDRTMNWGSYANVDFGIKNYSFTFTSPNFSNPHQLEFYYKLNNFDTDWIAAGTDRSANYTNLAPGRYVFQVKVRNQLHEWSKETPRFSFKVRAPWWMTAEFYTLLLVYGMVLVVLIILLVTYRLRKRKETLEALVAKRTQELEERHKVIQDNLLYAERIQRAILPMKTWLEGVCDDYFLIWEEKDVVGGDFYWFYDIPDSTQNIFAVLDCTGHGVPGAFLTMIGNSILNMVVKEQGVTDPGLVLQRLHEGFQQALHQESDHEMEQMEGMDASIGLVDKEQKQVKLASAKGIIYSYYKGELKQLKIKGRSIGGKNRKKANPFETIELTYDSPLLLYLLTDGLIDQHGPSETKEHEKFGSKRWRKWVEEHKDLPLKEQGESLSKAIHDFRHPMSQRDDITVLAIKLV